MRRQRGTPPTLHAHRNGKGSGTVHLGDQERRHGIWREDFGDRVASSLHRRKAATWIKITATVGKRQGHRHGHAATPRDATDPTLPARRRDWGLKKVRFGLWGVLGKRASRNEQLLVSWSLQKLSRSFPYTLAENAGLNPIAIVTELRNWHAQG
ncbi:hypothetical protein GW17_00033155 [Ensete ventricosum]|nr:hypothetical protein GW17_00033155 [Ensete ventricosum]